MHEAASGPGAGSRGLDIRTFQNIRESSDIDSAADDGEDAGHEDVRCWTTAGGARRELFEP